MPHFMTCGVASCSFGVLLTEVPTSPVTVEVLPGDEALVSVLPTELVFTPEDYSEQLVNLIPGARINCSRP